MNGASIQVRCKTTLARQKFNQFLGKKNIKGLYKNPLAQTPKYAKFDQKSRFITAYPLRKIPRTDSPSSHIDWDSIWKGRLGGEGWNSPSDQPFPHNPYTVSSPILSEEFKTQIFKDHTDGISFEKISLKYHITVPRARAIVKLRQIENKMEAKKSITGDMRKLASTMDKFFPKLDLPDKSTKARDGLTEVPSPPVTEIQNFISLAESEPFGPIDAAHYFGLQPATKVLEDLTSGTQSTSENTRNTTEKVAFLAPKLEGESKAFRFTNAKVGDVGYRYGASRDDRKHARRVAYDDTGKMHYVYN